MPSLTSKPPGQRQRRKLERPQELLEAALALFVEKGFAATRAEEVAARAGVSKGTLYLYYPSKEELFKAMVREYLGTLIYEGKQAVETFEGSSADLLGLVMRRWWAEVGMTAAGGICKIIIGEARNFPELARFYVDEVIAPTHALLGSVIERGMASGEFRTVPVAATVHVLIGPPLHMILYKHSIGACCVLSPDLEPAEVLEVQLGLMLSGMRAR